jgi:hypothetical protein
MLQWRWLADQVPKRIVVWVPACDAYGIVACRDAGMTKLAKQLSLTTYPRFSRLVYAVA